MRRPTTWWAGHFSSRSRTGAPVDNGCQALRTASEESAIVAVLPVTRHSAPCCPGQYRRFQRLVQGQRRRRKTDAENDIRPPAMTGGGRAARQYLPRTERRDEQSSGAKDVEVEAAR